MPLTRAVAPCEALQTCLLIFRRLFIFRSCRSYLIFEHQEMRWDNLLCLLIQVWLTEKFFSLKKKSFQWKPCPRKPKLIFPRMKDIDSRGYLPLVLGFLLFVCFLVFFWVLKKDKNNQLISMEIGENVKNSWSAKECSSVIAKRIFYWALREIQQFTELNYPDNWVLVIKAITTFKKILLKYYTFIFLHS